MNKLAAETGVSRGTITACGSCSSVQIVLRGGTMNRLKERRLALGLSQPEVSAKLKEIDPRMDVSMVSRF